MEGYNEDVNIDEVVDFLIEIEEYMYDWASSYTGKYTPVDHRGWHESFLIIMQQYHFDINKIKEDIRNGKIILTSFKETNPKFLAIQDKLYKAHKANVKKFENKYKLK